MILENPLGRKYSDARVKSAANLRRHTFVRQPTRVWKFQPLSLIVALLITLIEFCGQRTRIGYRGGRPLHLTIDEDMGAAPRELSRRSARGRQWRLIRPAGDRDVRHLFGEDAVAYRAGAQGGPIARAR